MDKIFEVQPMDSFTLVSEELVTNLYNLKPSSRLDVGIQEMQVAKESLKKIISGNNFDANKVSEIFQSKGWDESKVSLFLSLLEKNRAEILHSALLSHYSQYGETVHDFNWFLKLVVGTNDMKTIRYPLLQLLLSTVNSENKKHTLFDINKDVLAKLISLLENVENYK